MAPFIYGARNNIHIIDLTQTVPMLHQALVKVSDTVAGGGRVLFVGTKRQASESIADAAKRSAQYFINHRWLGGTLTNWKTISPVDPPPAPARRHPRRAAGPHQEGDPATSRASATSSTRRSAASRTWAALPDLLFVIDTNKESIAIKEAKKLGIPIVAIVDTNCDPDGIDFPIPGNDDAGRAITLYCDLVARAALDGIERGQAAAGVDVGASEAPPAEELPAKSRLQGHRRAARRGRRPEAPARHQRRSSSSGSTTPASSTSGRSPISTPRRPRRSTARSSSRARSTRDGWVAAGQEAGRRPGGLSVRWLSTGPERRCRRHDLGCRRRRRARTMHRADARPDRQRKAEPSMTTISASLVKELRDKTGAGMMDCKTALTETKGDIEAAVDWLRKKGLSKAAKKAGRIAAEGLIGVAAKDKSGAIVEVNSETDFVARNEQFQDMVRNIAVAGAEGRRRRRQAAGHAPIPASRSRSRTRSRRWSPPSART